MFIKFIQTGNEASGNCEAERRHSRSDQLLVSGTKIKHIEVSQVAVFKHLSLSREESQIIQLV